MEIINKDDGWALSMFDCFVGEETLLGYFLWFLPTDNKKLARIIVQRFLPKFTENIYPICFQNFCR